MKFEEFRTVEFRFERKQWVAGVYEGIVYVFCFVTNGMEIPFYVGQTNRFSGRMNDYSIASFAACTDFCVGEAVKYLRDRNQYRIIVKHKRSDDPRRDEKAIIRDLLISGVRLLNCLPKYDYKTDNEAEERKLVQKYCDMLIATHKGIPNG